MVKVKKLVFSFYINMAGNKCQVVVRTAKSRLLKVLVTDSQFTDDLVMYTVTRAALVSAGRRFVRLARGFLA